MALAFDAATSSSQSGPATTLSWSHTCSGSNRVLIVGARMGQGNTITGITYNGVALTSIGSKETAGAARVEQWRLVAPATGAHDVVISFSGTISVGAGGAVSFTGADQTTPVGTQASGSGTSTTASCTVTSATGEIVVDCAAALANATWTVGASQTERWNIGFIPGNTVGSTEAGAASVTMDWTLSTSQAWVSVGVSVKPSLTGAVLAGQSDGTSTATGALTPGSLTGSATGTSSASATGLRQTQPLAGSAGGTSSASGTLPDLSAALAATRFGQRPQKTVLYALYDSLAGVGEFTGTATLQGWWYDVTSTVSFGVTATGGTSDIVVRRLAKYGAMGEQYESSGMDITVKHGYRLDVWIADRDTLRGVDPSTWGRLLYRGTIEYYESDLNGVDLTVAHIGRIARTAPIKGDYTLTGGAAGVQSLIGTYLPGITWDTNNSVTSGHTSGNPQPQTVKSIYVADALNSIVQAAGKDWFWFVTPTGTLRFFVQSRSGTPATGSTRHVLTVGGEIVGSPRLGKDQRDRRTEISLWWNNAGTMTEANVQGATYDAKDPRTLIVQRQDITDATDAAAAAQGMLNEYDRIKLTAQVVVSDAAYDIESISVGDVVRLVVPRLVGTNSFAGYQDFNDSDLVVMGLRYDFDSVTLDLDGLFPATAVAAGTSPLTSMAARVRALEARVA